MEASPNTPAEEDTEASPSSRVRVDTEDRVSTPAEEATEVVPNIPVAEDMEVAARSTEEASLAAMDRDPLVATDRDRLEVSVVRTSTADLRVASTREEEVATEVATEEEATAVDTRSSSALPVARWSWCGVGLDQASHCERASLRAFFLELTMTTTIDLRWTYLG